MISPSRHAERYPPDAGTNVKLNLDRCSVVLAGAWNPAIFSPPWVAKRLFSSTEMEVGLAFGDMLVLRFGTKDVELVVTSSSVQLRPRRVEQGVFDVVEDVAVRLLETLRETPVRAFGINFGYDVEREGKPLKELVDLQRGRPARTTRISRSFEIGSESGRRGERAVMNVVLADPTDGALHLDFNEHHDAEPASGHAPGARAAERLKGRVSRAREMAQEMANELYELTEVTSG